jgi:hypothetical protein
VRGIGHRFKTKIEREATVKAWRGIDKSFEEKTEKFAQGAKGRIDAFASKLGENVRTSKKRKK